MERCSVCHRPISDDEMPSVLNDRVACSACASVSQAIPYARPDVASASAPARGFKPAALLAAAIGIITVVTVLLWPRPGQVLTPVKPQSNSPIWITDTDLESEINDLWKREKRGLTEEKIEHTVSAAFGGRLIDYFRFAKVVEIKPSGATASVATASEFPIYAGGLTIEVICVYELAENEMNRVNLVRLGSSQSMTGKLGSAGCSIDGKHARLRLYFRDAHFK